MGDNSVMKRIDKGYRNRLIIAAVIVLVLVGGGLFLENRSDGSLDRAMADRCTSQVESRLKSPSTAQFSDVRAMHDEAADTWTVEGNVDSQNGFGATVRSHFVCPDFTIEDFYISDVTVE